MPISVNTIRDNVERQEAEAKVEKAESDVSSPSAMAEDVRLRLEDIVKDLPETHPQKATYTTILENFKTQIEQFNPNKETNTEDKAAFEKLKAETPQQTWETAYRGWYEGLSHLISVADVYAQTENKSDKQTFLLFEYLKALNGDIPKDQIEEVIKNDVASSGYIEDAREMERATKVLMGAVNERLTPFNKYAKDFERLTPEQTRERVNKEATERRRVLNGVVDLIEEANKETIGNPVYEDKKTFIREVKVETTATISPASEKEAEKKRLELFQKAFGDWDKLAIDKDGKPRKVDTTEGKDLIEAKWHGPKRFNPDKDHEIKQVNSKVRVKNEDGSRQVVPIKTTEIKLYQHKLLSEVNGVDFGTAVKNDFVVRTEAFEFNPTTVDATGLMIDMLKVPPAKEVKADGKTVKYEVPVMHRGKPTWLVVSAKQHNAIAEKLQQSKEDFERLGFRYDPEKALKEGKFTNEPVKTENKPKIERQQVVALRTSGELATDWAEHSIARRRITGMASIAVEQMPKDPKEIKEITKAAMKANAAMETFAEKYGRRTEYEAEVLEKMKGFEFSDSTEEWKTRYALEMQLILDKYAKQAHNIKAYHQELSQLFDVFSSDYKPKSPEEAAQLLENRERLMFMLKNMNMMVTPEYNLSPEEKTFQDEIRSEMHRKPLDEAKKARTEFGITLEKIIVGGGSRKEKTTFTFGKDSDNLEEDGTPLKMQERFDKYIGRTEKAPNGDETRIHIIKDVEQVGLQDTEFKDASLVFVDMPDGTTRARVWFFVPNKAMEDLSETFERQNMMDRDFIPEIAMQVAHVDYPQYRTNERRKTTIVKI